MHPIYAPHQLFSHEPLSLPVAGGNSLAIAPNVLVPYRISYSLHSGEETDAVVSTTELVDADGNVFRGKGFLGAYDILDQMGSLTAFDPVMSISAEERTLRLNETNTFFTGARCLLDDRMVHQMAVEDQVWVMPFHYQAPKLTLYFDADPEFGTLWLHAIASGFYGFPASDLPSPAEMESGELADDDFDEPEPQTLPDLHFPVDLKAHYFQSHYAQPGDMEKLIVPRPIVFERAEGEKQEPNPSIEWHQKR